MSYHGRHTAVAVQARVARRHAPPTAGLGLGRIGVAGLAVGSAMMAVAVAPVVSWPAWPFAAAAATAPPPVPMASENPTDVQVAAPARISVPALGLDAPVVPLGLEPDGTLQVPEDFAATGWYVDGPEPGEFGPSVILGHVDSYDGPAVFNRLDELKPGDAIEVSAINGSRVSFVVDRVELHPKDRFPTAEVYGPTGEPALRLITCGGRFDHSARAYDDNLVVFARLATPFPPPRTA